MLVLSRVWKTSFPLGVQKSLNLFAYKEFKIHIFYYDIYILFSFLEKLENNGSSGILLCNFCRAQRVWKLYCLLRYTVEFSPSSPFAWKIVEIAVLCNFCWIKFDLQLMIYQQNSIYFSTMRAVSSKHQALYESDNTSSIDLDFLIFSSTILRNFYQFFIAFIFSFNFKFPPISDSLYSNKILISKHILTLLGNFKNSKYMFHCEINNFHHS